MSSFLPFNGADIKEQLEGVVAEIYMHDNASTQAIANGSTYAKVINFTANGTSKNSTSDYENNKIVLTKSGIYTVSCTISFTGSGANVNWFPAVHKNDEEQNNIHFQRKIAAALDYGSSQEEGFVVVEDADLPCTIDLRIRHDSGSQQNLTVKYCTLKATRVGIL